MDGQTSGYLAGKKVYLGGPIEFSTGTAWRDEVVPILRDRFKLDVFDPFADPKQQWSDDLHKAREDRDFETMARIAERFVAKDLAVVDGCAFTIHHLPYKVCTTGSHHEIINASNLKKPTLLVCPAGKEYLPLWYYGFINHEEFMHGSWESLYEYLDGVDRGLYKANKRWRMVYGLI